MKEKDYRFIRKVIMSDAERGEIGDLIQLREMLDEQIALARERTSVASNHFENHEENFHILNLNLCDFLSIKSYGIKFMRQDIVSAIKKIRGLDGIVLVVDSVGIGKNTLLKEDGIGLRTVLKYEKALNNYGYSLDNPMTEEQVKQFQYYHRMNKK